MEEAVKLLGITVTDEQINHIAQRHIEKAEVSFRDILSFSMKSSFCSSFLIFESVFKVFLTVTECVISYQNSVSQL